MKYKNIASGFILSFVCGTSLSSLSTGAFAQSSDEHYNTVDAIAAVVNDGVITMRELNKRFEEVKRNVAAQQNKQTLPPDDELRLQVLERMIVEKTQEQEAINQGIRVDDNQLDRTIALIAEQNNVSIDELRTRVEAEGLPYRMYRENLRQDILMTRLRERNVDNQVVISERDIDVFLQNQSLQENQRINEQWHLAQIFVSVPENASEQEERAAFDRAQYLAGLAQKNPADFARIAKANSEGQEGERGGDLGVRNASQWPPQFVNVLRTVSGGGVSPVISTEYGFHIVKVIEKRATPGSQDPVAITQTHARHILIKPSAILTSEQAREKLEGIRLRIVNGTDFADMAKQYSNDSSAPQGGDLGWLSPGETVPQFEEAMNRLSDNQMSDLVETPFGWHLIQVLGRRDQDVTDNVRRAKARQALRETRLQSAFEDWARQVRDSAYVDIRLGN